MPKILVNFDKDSLGIRILRNEKIFPDLPIAVCEWKEYHKPVLIQTDDYIFPEIIEETELSNLLKENDNNVEENKGEDE